MTQLLARWEPFSPQRLRDKSHQLTGEGGSGFAPINRPTYHTKLSSSDLDKQRKTSVRKTPSDSIEENLAEDEEEAKNPDTLQA